MKGTIWGRNKEEERNLNMTGTMLSWCQDYKGSDSLSYLQANKSAPPPPPSFMDAAEDTRLLCQKQRTLWEFPGGPVVRILGFYCHGLCLIPGQGTETLQASQCSQKKKKKKAFLVIIQ